MFENLIYLDIASLSRLSEFSCLTWVGEEGNWFGEADGFRTEIGLGMDMVWGGRWGWGRIVYMFGKGDGLGREMGWEGDGFREGDRFGEGNGLKEGDGLGMEMGLGRETG